LKLCGQVLATYNTNTSLSPVEFSVAVAFTAGAIELIFGVLRLGIIVDLISSPVIAGFTSGAAISIICTQLPSLLGISGINTQNPAYLVVGNTVSSLHSVKLDAAFGFSTIIFLALWRLISRELTRNKYSFGTLFGQVGNAVALVIFTLISFGVNYNRSPLVKIVGLIPSGISYIGVPNVSHMSSVFPAAATVVLVAIMEHIAVTKSFARVNGYKIKPNQEIFALGVVNLLGSFFGAFAATGNQRLTLGSFSRSAVKSRSGVKTPLAGLFTAAIVLIAIFFLTTTFANIPVASLSGLIIFAITDLISRPHVVIDLYKFQFTDFLSFFVALVVTFFTSIEVGIYSSVGFSVLVLLYRVARPSLQFLVQNDGKWEEKDDYEQLASTGIAVFKIEESLTYPNANYVSEKIKKVIYGNTKVNEDPNRERLWCEEPHTSHTRSQSGSKAPRIAFLSSSDINRTPSETPLSIPSPSSLRALILDFSAVNNMDSTGLQCLLDIRDDIQRHTSEPVPILFANVRRRLVKSIHQFHKIVAPNHQVTPMVAEPTAFVGTDSAGVTEEVDVSLSKDSFEFYHDHEHMGCSLVFGSIDDAIQSVVV
jgi:solute carrier family 26 (sodium-independent sulfate anion transporter), member 11